MKFSEIKCKNDLIDFCKPHICLDCEVCNFKRRENHLAGCFVSADELANKILIYHRNKKLAKLLK